MMRARAGFTLLEMMVAVSLSSMVLIGVMSVSTTMIRKHMDGIRKGTVTGGALVSFANMSREVERANVLISPTSGTPDSNLLGGCVNWSRLMAAAPGAKLDPSKALEVFYYCYNPGARTIWYYSTSVAAVCPAAPPAVACDGSAAYPTRMQVAQDVELLAPNARVFTRDDSIGGVRIHYVVGQQVPTAARQVPIFVPFDVTLSMQKAYLNTSD